MPGVQERERSKLTRIALFDLLEVTSPALRMSGIINTSNRTSGFVQRTQLGQIKYIVNCIEQSLGGIRPSLLK
jgi:hypothetical protein